MLEVLPLANAYRLYTMFPHCWARLGLMFCDQLQISPGFCEGPLLLVDDSIGLIRHLISLIQNYYLSLSL